MKITKNYYEREQKINTEEEEKNIKREYGKKDTICLKKIKKD